VSRELQMGPGSSRNLPIWIARMLLATEVFTAMASVSLPTSGTGPYMVILLALASDLFKERNSCRAYLRIKIVNFSIGV